MQQEVDAAMSLVLVSQASSLASPHSLFCSLSYGLFPSGLFSCVTSSLGAPCFRISLSSHTGVFALLSTSRHLYLPARLCLALDMIHGSVAAQIYTDEVWHNRNIDHLFPYGSCREQKGYFPSSLPRSHGGCSV